EGLHRTREGEAQDQRPEGLPEHEEALAQAPPDVFEHAHERTSRAIAAVASAILASASGPPPSIASRTQWSRWASRSSSATPSGARLAAAIWVRTSMQYVSSSPMRCTPRT